VFVISLGIINFWRRYGSRIKALFNRNAASRERGDRGASPSAPDNNNIKGSKVAPYPSGPAGAEEP
jgi:hypothetical protein